MRRTDRRGRRQPTLRQRNPETVAARILLHLRARAPLRAYCGLRLQVIGRSDSHGQAIYYPDPSAGRSTTASAAVVYQPSERWSESLAVTYSNFDRAAGGERLYDYLIARSRTTFQVNRFLFFRGIVEYNSFRRQLMTDLLASFTYIPGTVIHAGYGSLYEQARWDGTVYVRDRSFREMRRGLFFKASYLWRL